LFGDPTDVAQERRTNDEAQAEDSETAVETQNDDKDCIVANRFTCWSLAASVHPVSVAVVVASLSSSSSSSSIDSVASGSSATGRKGGRMKSVANGKPSKTSL
jgi:hypothetical protein